MRVSNLHRANNYSSKRPPFEAGEATDRPTDRPTGILYDRPPAKNHNHDSPPKMFQTNQSTQNSDDPYIQPITPQQAVSREFPSKGKKVKHLDMATNAWRAVSDTDNPSLCVTRRHFLDHYTHPTDQIDHLFPQLMI